MALPALTTEELARYSRHLLIPSVGEEGQRRLKASSVLLIGAGGLGCPAALYLAAAGVGRIGLVDPDRVDRSNLQRQVLFGEASVGEPKTTAAARRLHDINPGVTLDLHPVRFTPENALLLAAGYDIIIDGSDNFPTRFLTCDTAFFLKKPLIHAAIQRFEGQLAVFTPYLGGPCYRCLLPASPPPGAVPSCAEAGVLGVLPGILGSLQAMETIKLLLHLGEPPSGRMLCYDALRTSFRSVMLKKDPRCPLCGGHPTISSVSNPETAASAACATADIPEITPADLRQLLDTGFPGILIDVRDPYEHAARSIPGARSIPLATLPEASAEFPRDQEIIVHCQFGGRSSRAAKWLIQNGFTRVRNLSGGIQAWRE
jgi:molybdopterin/thiamine biosynthesis adenylyltransferase/rhodanese-related sulfurtransferase